MSAAFEKVGTGQAVYAADPVEGPVRWLDTPAAVIDFVAGEGVADTIVLVRGGTTTFLTPALNAGVKGIVTLQGAPESHLGILAREYGIPCVMGVAFDKGVRTERGETVPADGVTIRLDTSADGAGTVLAPEDAPVDDGSGPEPAAAMDAETMAAIESLLASYRGEVPHADEGDRQIRAGMETDVLQLDDEAGLRRDLTDQEVDELQYYSGWNMWDSLAARATEGESGLIPRQEYEAVGFVQAWNRYPQLMEMITDEVGVDGLFEIGATARREVGTKVNLLHTFGLGLAPAFGRGISVGLGQITTAERTDDLAAAMQFMRRAYRGLWGGGSMLTSMRGYEARVLDDDLVERFADEAEPVPDADARKAFQLFSADTELLGFLLHFDNRLGLADSGPYPLPGGRFMVVRDHFLSDDVYSWFDVAAELPHAITQAMIFEPTEPLRTQVFDISTLFTEPANYLKHLVATGLYARDRWDTPMSELRRIDAAEREAIRARAREASDRLYRRIALMSRREKVMAGATVYYTEYILPFARLAGLWDTFRADHDFNEFDPLTSEAYYPLVTGGKATTLVPELFLTGAGFPPVVDAGEDGADGAGEDAGGAGEVDPAELERDFPSLHLLALRGSAESVRGDAAALVADGLVIESSVGLMLSEDGHARHVQMLAAERAGIDLDALRATYDRFLAVNDQLKGLSSRWQSAGADDRPELVHDLGEVIDRVEPSLRRAADLVPRFDAYGSRLRAARERLEAGDADYAVSPQTDSIHTVWMEVHEDYLQLLEISREAEGSH